MLRWGAMVTGVFYGFSHQTAITSRDKAAHAQHEWDSKAKLIDQAKAEYQRKTQPQSKSGGESINRAFGDEMELGTV